MLTRIHSVSIAALGLLISTSNALAHEGHGNPASGSSVVHYLLEPVHLPLTLGLLGVLVVASRWLVKKLLVRRRLT